MNVYYMDWRQRLVMYDKGPDRFVFAEIGIPKFSGQPGTVTVTGMMAFAKDTANNVIYFSVYNGMLAAIHPRETGMGWIEHLGGLIPKKYFGPDIPPWHALTPDMAMGKNGKVYYFVGSEGRYVEEGKNFFVEYDPMTRKKRVLHTFSASEIALVSGSNTTDSEGSMYFAAIKRVMVNSHRQDIPFLIKFNPEKSVK